MSLSYDELFSVYFAQQGPGFLLGQGWHQETNPPLYFLLLDGWMGLFGDSAVAIRSLSLLAGAATVAVVIRIGRAAGMGEGAWLAGAFYLTTAIAAHYDMTARPYALWVLALAVALLALVEAIAAATLERLWPWAAGFAAAGLVALYLHDATLMFVAAADGVFLLVWLTRWPLRPMLLAVWALPQLLMVAAGVPQLLIIWEQRGSANIAWIGPPSLDGLIQMGLDLLGGPGFRFELFPEEALLLSLILLLFVVPVRASRRVVLGGLILLGPLFLFAAGLLLPRTGFWLVLPLAVLKASSLVNLRTEWVRAGLIGIALTLAGLDTANFLWVYRAEPWRELLAMLDAQRRPGDAIVVMNAAPATAFRYYYPAGAGAALYRWDATPIDRPGTALRTIDDRILPLAAIDASGIRNLLLQGHGVWFLSRQRSQLPMLNALAATFKVNVAHQEGEALLLGLAPRGP